MPGQQLRPDEGPYKLPPLTRASYHKNETGYSILKHVQIDFKGSLDAEFRGSTPGIPTIVKKSSFSEVKWRNITAILRIIPFGSLHFSRAVVISDKFFCSLIADPNIINGMIR